MSLLRSHLPMNLVTLGKKFALVAQAMMLAFGFSAFTIAAATMLPASAAYADDCTDGPSGSDPLAAGAACSHANGTSSDLFAEGGGFQTAANTLIFVVGAVAVIFLIIGGLRYVISNGDSKNVTAAKDTILYAIIGIVV